MKELSKSKEFTVATTTNDINAGYRFPNKEYYKVSIFPNNFQDEVRSLKERTDMTLRQCWDHIVPYDPRFSTGWLRDFLQEITADMETYESRRVEITLTIKVLEK